jgi:hypothetical protein
MYVYNTYIHIYIYIYYTYICNTRRLQFAPHFVGALARNHAFQHQLYYLLPGPVHFRTDFFFEFFFTCMYIFLIPGNPIKRRTFKRNTVGGKLVRSETYLLISFDTVIGLF